MSHFSAERSVFKRKKLVGGELIDAQSEAPSRIFSGFARILSRYCEYQIYIYTFESGRLRILDCLLRLLGRITSSQFFEQVGPKCLNPKAYPRNAHIAQP